MYKGLKPELTDVIDRINPGDGIIIRHPSSYSTDPTMGYVDSKTQRFLDLVMQRNQNGFLDKAFHSCRVHYEYIENVEVVDPAKNDPSCP